MKYLILLLFLTGCNADVLTTVNPKLLMFKAGETVKVKQGFYSDCKANIVDYIHYCIPSQGYRYSVNLNCPNKTYLQIIESESNLEKLTKAVF